MLITKSLFTKDNWCSTIIKFLLSAETHTIILVEFDLNYLFDWFNDNITKLMSHKQRLQYAVYAAELVLPIFEKEHPNDKRPREAIEAVKRCIDNPSEENKKLAKDASKNSYNFSYTARTTAASHAAYSAASIFYSTTRTSNAAYCNSAYYAVSAVKSTSYVYDDKEIQNEIIEYGLKLLDEKK